MTETSTSQGASEREPAGKPPHVPADREQESAPASADGATVTHQPSPQPGAREQGGPASAPEVTERYEVAQLLGEGGMGQVWHAHDNKLAREVALKVMTGRSDARSAERFVQEAQVQARLQHPGIAPVHDLDLDQSSHPYFTMKLVRGASLAERLAQLRQRVRDGGDEADLPLVARLDVFRKVCDAVSYAHSHGIIHRDLKPANIMVGEFGEVQVMDWGLAKDLRLTVDGVDALDPPTPAPGRVASVAAESPSIPGGSHDLAAWTQASHTHTMQGEVLGTPRFMAPEQARGEVSEIDERSDVFSLGAVLWNLLALKPPPRPTTDLSDWPPAPSAAVASDGEIPGGGRRFSRELDAVVGKAMAVDPEDRYQTVHALRLDIDRFLGGQLLQAGRYSMPQRLVRWMRRHRTALLAALGVVVLVGGILAVVREAQQQAAAQQLEDSLAPFSEVVEQAATRLVAVAGEDSDERVLAGTAALLADMREPLEEVASAQLVARYRPEVASRARSLLTQIETTGVDARRSWAQARLQRARELMAAGTAAPLAEARTLLQDTVPELLPELPSIPDLPVAEIHLVLAELSGREVEVSGADPAAAAAAVAVHIVRAWQAQPQSTASAEGLVLLAEENLSRASRTSVADAARQFLLARDVVAGLQPRLAARCLLGAAAALAGLAQSDPSPFAEGVRAHEHALAMVLAVIDLDGKPRAAMGLNRDEDGSLLDRADDLLSILRITVPTAIQTEELIVSGELAENRYARSAGKDIEIVRVEQQSVVANSPSVVDVEERYELAGVLSRLELEASQVYGPYLPRHGEIAAWWSVMTSDGKYWIVWTTTLLSLDDLQKLETLAHVRMASLGDVDGDGHADLVLGLASIRALAPPRLGRAYVCFGDASGITDQVTILEHELQQLNPTDISKLQGASAYDLDTDGVAEVVVARGLWYYQALELWEVKGDRTANLVDKIRCGTPYRTQLLDDSADPILLVHSQLDFETQLSWEASGAEVGDAELLLVLRDRELVQLPAPGRRFPPGALTKRDADSSSMAGRFELRPGVFVHPVRSSPGRVPWWRLVEGTVAEPRNPRSYRIGTSAGRVAGELFRTYDGISRRMSRADLQAWEAPPLPSLTWQARWKHRSLQQADLLLELGRPAAAAELLATVATRGDAEAHAATVTLRLQALIAAGQHAELAAMLQQLQPRAELLPVMVRAFDEMLRMSLDLARAVQILEGWEASPDLLPRQKDRIRTRHRDLQKCLAELLEPAIVVQGKTIATSAGEEAVADFWTGDLSSELEIDDEGWTVVGSHTFALYGAVMKSYSLITQWGGIPIQLGTGALRVEVELDLPGLAHGAGFWAGLAAWPPTIESPGDLTLQLSCRGGSGVHRAYLTPGNGASWWMDAHSGKRVRWVEEIVPSLQLRRRMLWDVESHELLYLLVQPWRRSPGMDAPMLLGVGNSRLSPHQARIHALRVSGDAKLVRLDDERLLRLWGAPQWKWKDAVARGTRARLRAETDEAERLLLAASEELRSLPIDKYADRRTSAARRLALEAAWVGGGQESLVAAAVDLQNRGVLDESDLLYWVLAHPTRTNIAHWRAYAAAELACASAPMADSLRLGLEALARDTPTDASAELRTWSAVDVAAFGFMDDDISYYMNSGISHRVAQLAREVAATGDDFPRDLMQLRAFALYTLSLRSELLATTPPEAWPTVHPQMPHLERLTRLLLEKGTASTDQRRDQAARLKVTLPR